MVAAGAFGSPQLLMLAGIGPADHLREVGVEPVVDLPGVGANLQDHPEGVVVWSTTRPVPEPIVQEWEVGIFADVLGLDGGAPDLMFHLGLVPFDAHTTALGYPIVSHGVSLTPNVCRSRGRGTVRLRSNHPLDVPAIDFAYSRTATATTRRSCCRRGAGAAHHGAARGRRLDRRGAGPGSRSARPDRAERVRATDGQHRVPPAGTCSIGTDVTDGAVVGPDLRGCTASRACRSRTPRSSRGSPVSTRHSPR